MVGILWMGALTLLPPPSADAQAKKKQLEPYAVLGGTVFQESGLSLAGAKVVLTLKSEPKKKLQEQMSSPHGEFAFRVSPEPAVYTLTATLKGYEPTQLDVEIQGQEQVHKSLILPVASKKR
jgi:hypothetical protein